MVLTRETFTTYRKKEVDGGTRTNTQTLDTHTHTHTHTHSADLVDVFEFVYDLADDRLGGLVASGLGAGVRSLQARPGKPDRPGRQKGISWFFSSTRLFLSPLFFFLYWIVPIQTDRGDTMQQNGVIFRRVSHERRTSWTGPFLSLQTRRLSPPSAQKRNYSSSVFVTFRRLESQLVTQPLSRRSNSSLEDTTSIKLNSGWYFECLKIDFFISVIKTLKRLETQNVSASEVLKSRWCHSLRSLTTIIKSGWWFTSHTHIKRVNKWLFILSALVCVRSSLRAGAHTSRRVTEETRLCWHLCMFSGGGASRVWKDSCRCFSAPGSGGR